MGLIIITRQTADTNPIPDIGRAPGISAGYRTGPYGIIYRSIPKMKGIGALMPVSAGPFRE